MLTIAELRSIAQARLEDAQVLLASDRHDGAIYLSGYAVEIALKARICETLHWAGYPSTSSEFRDYQTFRTHNLDVLLRLSGIENEILTDALAEWSAVAYWDPEVRYSPVGGVSEAAARSMIDATALLLASL